ncbi:MAG: 30S ribosomal protein S20 [Patescibacteria group bacterium]|nr:30S ribosomal protein S20 [Patescibacteria group bacterium]
MPVTTSAIKKARQDIRNREQNRVIRDAAKLAVKKVRKLAEAGKKKEAEEALRDAYSKIDKAAKKNIIHKNSAARKKARLSKLLTKDKKKEAKKEK